MVLALVLDLVTPILVLLKCHLQLQSIFCHGCRIQYTYSRQIFTTLIYTVVASSLFNPIPEIQLSAELEQLRVNVSGTGQNNFSDNFWNTGLFIGAGYRTGNVTLGALQCFIQR
jgi:hypothetical protein